MSAANAAVADVSMRCDTQTVMPGSNAVRTFTLQDQGDTFELETPFGRLEIRLVFNIHGMGLLLKQ
jgi:hypothetical protein